MKPLSPRDEDKPRSKYGGNLQKFKKLTNKFVPWIEKSVRAGTGTRNRVYSGSRAKKRRGREEGRGEELLAPLCMLASPTRSEAEEKKGEQRRRRGVQREKKRRRTPAARTPATDVRDSALLLLFSSSFFFFFFSSSSSFSSSSFSFSSLLLSPHAAPCLATSDMDQYGPVCTGQYTISYQILKPWSLLSQEKIAIFLFKPSYLDTLTT